MDDRIAIRAATAEDQPSLLALMRRASLANRGDRDLLLAYPELVRLPARHLTADRGAVALYDGALAGFAVVLPREGGDADLDALFVEPWLWRNGIGRTLVERCLSLAAAMGATRLHVVGNPHAEGFYQRLGFIETERVPLTFGHGLLMQRPV